MQVAVCTPTRGDGLIQVDTAHDLLQMGITAWYVVKGTILAKQRETLVLHAGADGATHILWIDSDMRFPADTAERLLAHDLPIVGANCRHRSGDRWTAGRSSIKKHGVQEVEQIGFGVTLTAIEVFEKLPRPWFATPHEDGNYIGEDVFFCRAVRDCGFSIYIDHDLSQDVKHIGTTEF